MRFVSAVLLAAFLAAAPIGSGVAADDETVPAFTPKTGTFEHYTEAWQVWTVRDEYGDPRRRAIPYRTRYFVQGHDADTARLTFEMGGTYSRKVATVLEDGTLVLTYANSLLWAPPDGEAREEHLKIDDVPAHVAEGYPDGLVIQASRLMEEAPFYFVPIEGRALRFAKKFRLTAGSVRVSSRPRIVRGGNVLAWQRTVFDLRTRRRRTFDKGGTPRACDGETVVYWGWSNDGYLQYVYPTKGAAEPTTIPIDGAQRAKAVFAVRNRIGYYVAYGGGAPGALHRPTIHALDLTSPESRRIQLLEMAEQPRRVRAIRDHEPPAPYMLLKAGLVVWTGATWTTIPWLEAWPE